MSHSKFLFRCFLLFPTRMEFEKKFLILISFLIETVFNIFFQFFNKEKKLLKVEDIISIIIYFI